MTPIRDLYLSRANDIRARLLIAAPDGCGIAWVERTIKQITSGQKLSDDMQQWMADLEDHTRRIERAAWRKTSMRWFHMSVLARAFK